MLVRLTRLDIGKVIGDLLDRSICPNTVAVREKIRTINNLNVAGNNIVWLGENYQSARDTRTRK